MRLLMVFAGFLLVGAVFAGRLVDEDEVAKVVTFDVDGHGYQSALWVVDVGGHAFVRAVTPNAEWLERLRREPRVHVVRNGGMMTMRAIPESGPQVGDAVDRAMQEKYRLLDRVALVLRDHSQSVAVRLDPIATAAR